MLQSQYAIACAGARDFTFGNVSVADRKQGVFAIKPSGVPYEELSPEKMVIVDFDGNVVEGKLVHPAIPKTQRCIV